MIGLIITGHGHFATGMQTSIKLIAGEPINTEYINFEETDTPESLKEKYLTALNSKLNNCHSIIGLADLAGGTPFKTLVEVKTEFNKPMEVIGGTNLPMVLEISLTKDLIDDLDSLSSSALEIGKAGLIKFNLVIHEDLECEDGI